MPKIKPDDLRKNHVYRSRRNGVLIHIRRLWQRVSTGETTLVDYDAIESSGVRAKGTDAPDVLSQALTNGKYDHLGIYNESDREGDNPK